MIQNVVINCLNRGSPYLFLSMSRPNDYGVHIKKIDGLGPVKANIYTSERPTMDGDRYISSSVDSRNIVLSLGFTSSNNVEETRHHVYRCCPVKEPVWLRFDTDQSTTYIIEGYVESNEPDIFSKDEGTTISVICPDPYFYSMETSKELQKDISADPSYKISNDGSIDVGASIYIQFHNDVKSVRIYDSDNESNSMTISAENVSDIGKTFRTGDILELCTIPGKKEISLRRNGKEYNIINSLGKYPTWLKIKRRATNRLTYSVDSSSSKDDVYVYVLYKIAYEGI